MALTLSESAAAELGQLVREHRGNPRSRMGGSRWGDHSGRAGGRVQTGLLQIGIFELIETLSAGGTVEAYRLVWDPDPDDLGVADAEGAYITDDSETYILHDHLGMFEGNPGDYCKAELMMDSGQWSIYQKQCL